MRGSVLSNPRFRVYALQLPRSAASRGALAAAVLFTVLYLAASQSSLYTFKVVPHHFQLLSALSFLRLDYLPTLNYALQEVMYVSSWLVPDFPWLVWDTEWGKAVIGSALLPCLLTARLPDLATTKSGAVHKFASLQSI